MNYFMGVALFIYNLFELFNIDNKYAISLTTQFNYATFIATECFNWICSQNN